MAADGSNVVNTNNESPGVRIMHHGRSQSSFRSYTNHHMGSGSNHYETDDEDDENLLINNDNDCDTCYDRSNNHQKFGRLKKHSVLQCDANQNNSTRMTIP